MTSAPILAFKNSTMRNPGDGNKSICPLDIDEWVRLSYKVNMESIKDYTIYENAKYIIDNAVETAQNYSENYKKAAPIAKVNCFR